MWPIRTGIALLAGALLLALNAPARAVHPAVIEAENRRIETIEQLAPSVVAIFGSGGRGGGSGVLISPDGYALTNFHVVRGAGNFMKCGLNNGRLYDAVIVGVDPTGDVALIKLLGRDDFPHARLGDSETVAVGDWVYAMGNPFMLATDFQPTVTYGIVSGVHRYQYPAGTFLEYTDCIQVDASINPGNSGGPLFSEDGRLIGINGRASFEKRGRVNSGAAYAISTNQIKNFMGHLKSGRIVDHATLGAVVSSEDDGSVRVSDILETSEAYRRGLRLGDEVVSFAGRPVRSVNQFKNVLGIYPKGREVPLVYRREGEKHEIFVRLRGLHRESELTGRRPERPSPPDPDQPEDDDPDEQQPGDPRPEKPKRLIPHGQARRPDPPEAYRHMFVEKEGFANYYFNKLHQERLLDLLAGWGDFSDAGPTWRLSGQTSAGAPFEFILADTAAGLELDGRPFVQQLDQDPADEPPGTGGLLIALHHLQRLLTEGREGFSEFYYLGTEPLDGRGERVDVLVTELTGVESRWYFSRERGALRGFDTRLHENADDCEIRFLEVGPVRDYRLPVRMQVNHAGEEFATFHVEQADFTAPSEES